MNKLSVVQQRIKWKEQFKMLYSRRSINIIVKRDEIIVSINYLMREKNNFTIATIYKYLNPLNFISNFINDKNNPCNLIH